MTKLPSTAGIDGIRKNQTISVAVDGEELVVGLGGDHVALRVISSMRISAAATAAMTKKTRIENR